MHEHDLKISDPLFSDDATYFRLAIDRIDEITRLIRRNKPKSILDIGYHPGNIGRLISSEFLDVRIDGLGLANGTVVVPGYTRLYHGEMDPFYGPVAKFDFDCSYDLIIACEVIEHLINPFPMVSLLKTCLSNNGVALITTPNVSSFGAIARLVCGRSNYEDLERSVFMMNNEWRSHVRLYSKRELIRICGVNGLAVVSHRYYRNKSIDYERKMGVAWLARNVASLIPIYREDQMCFVEHRV